MQGESFPIWVAYIAAPSFVLLAAGKVIVKSESPWFLTAACIAAGLFCAAVLHAYVAIKKRFIKDE
jgi:hypothetical protein